MSGTNDKTSGSTRNYAKQPNTLAKRRSEYDSLMSSGNYNKRKSYFDKSGGFYAWHNDHKANKDSKAERFAAKTLAEHGYKVYMDKEKSNKNKLSTKDGYIYKSPMDIKKVSKAGKYTIKSHLEKATKQGAKTAVIVQGSKKVNRQYIDSQIKLFKEKSPRKAVGKLEYVIVVGKNGHVHRHKI